MLAYAKEQAYEKGYKKGYEIVVKERIEKYLNNIAIELKNKKFSNEEITQIIQSTSDKFLNTYKTEQ